MAWQYDSNFTEGRSPIGNSQTRAETAMKTTLDTNNKAFRHLSSARWRRPADKKDGK